MTLEYMNQVPCFNNYIKGLPFNRNMATDPSRDGILPQTGDLPPATRQAQSGALPGSAVAMPPYWSCRQPALHPSRTSLPAEPGVCPSWGGGREVARYCILHLRKREVAPLTRPVERHVGREPRHRGPARVGGRPCRLQFLVHLLEEGDAAGNWRGGASNVLACLHCQGWQAAVTGRGPGAELQLQGGCSHLQSPRLEQWRLRATGGLTP